MLIDSHCHIPLIKDEEAGATGVVERAVSGMPIDSLISILSGLALLALALTPLAIGASIKISLEV